ncbi:NACHT domain-containing protein [Madurella fahalii]|uniref:NACHT domain-containing protein n=1 Tax=Madurella fahalii TaxID=1157608 RepID=A0ABQ0GD34_9PEZI
MADVGTIVGVISLGIQVADGLVKYYTSYKDRESDTAHTVKRLTHLLDVLGILRRQLAERKFLPDEESLLKVIKHSVGDCEDLIRELQQETEKFTEASSGGFAAAARTTGRRLAYPFRQSTLQKLDEDIDEICANLALALQVLQHQDMSNAQSDIQDTKALLELMRASQVSSDIREWLKAPDASINYNEACKRKHPGTGLWFIKGPHFSTWLRTANSFLWLKGFAGCGKSVLSSTIIQHIFRHRSSDPLVGIAFFYFTFNDESKQNASSMLRALILQLVSQLKGQDTTLSQLHYSYRENTPPDQALLDCLRQVINRFDHVYIILDALDESPQHKHREDLLQTLEDMRRWSCPGMHLLVTSRDEQDIRESLEAQDDQVVSMKNDSIDADIASFVSAHLRENRRLRKWEKYHDRIEQAFTEGAQGVFRWVECQFAPLEACPGSKTRLDALLGSLPRTLDKTYERMLSNIDEESADDARRILTLLCTAKRPLTVEELIDGIAVELGDDPRFNEDSRLMNEADIRRICPGFIDSEVLDLYPRAKEPIRIAHYSVQEYLESDRILACPAAKFSVRRVQANTEVASLCLAYLMDPGLCEEFLAWERGKDTKYPLAEYAAQNWLDHYHAGDCSDPRLHRLALALIHDDQVASVAWANILSGKNYGRRRLGGSPLDLAARLGLDRVVRVLADEIAPAPPIDCLELALLEAAACGHATTVQLLLDYYGIAINYGGDKGTAPHLDEDASITWILSLAKPLEVAASNGHEEVVTLLLDRGADPNLGWRSSPLHAAVRHVDVARVLLSRGADVDMVGQGFLLALAASYGSTGMVNLLLDREADVNEGSPFTALERAASQLRSDTLQLLLERGADVNGGVCHTPLEAAASEGYTEHGQLLLDRGADVDLGIWNTPLETAAGRIFTEFVQLLLDRGASVNLGIKRMPLEVAAFHERVEHVQLLIDFGADIDLGIERTPLEAAAWSKEVESVRLLLDRGANVNLGIERTPLETAAYYGRTEHVRLLIDRGADINLGIIETPLEAAMSQWTGEMECVQLLLDRGADVNLGIKKTPLDAAVEKGHVDLVQLLLNRGANANLYIKNTPLEAAASRRGRILKEWRIHDGSDTSEDIDTTSLVERDLGMAQPDADGGIEMALPQSEDKKRDEISTPLLSDSEEKVKEESRPRPRPGAFTLTPTPTLTFTHPFSPPINATTPLLAAALASEPEPAEEETTPLPATPLSPARLWLTLSATYVGVFLGAVDSSILATLSASIAIEFRSLSLLLWLATAYLIANATFQPLSGRLTDIFGRGPGLVFSNVMFALGNLICGLARDEGGLILGRVVAGVGGGGLMSISTFLASDLVPLKRRGVVQGVVNIAYGTGAMLGGVLGGFINDTSSCG